MDWIWLIVALLVGLAIGGLVAWTLMKRRYGDRESVVELRNELDRYRGKVTEHFVETADLVNTLTRNYKRVYDHLESGAYDLVGEEKLRRELDAPEEAPVMLEYLGQRRTTAAASRSASEPAPAAKNGADAKRAAGAPSTGRPSTDERSETVPRPAPGGAVAGRTDVAGTDPAVPSDADAATADDHEDGDAEERTRSAG